MHLKTCTPYTLSSYQVDDTVRNISGHRLCESNLFHDLHGVLTMKVMSATAKQLIKHCTDVIL